MDLTLPTQRPRTCESEISSLESSSQTLSVEAIRHHDGISPSTPVDQEASQCHQRVQQQYATEHQPEPNAETFLLNEDGSTKEAANKISSPARWNALGLFAIGILVLGTVGIIVGMSLPAYIWRSSMRAQAGHIDNGQLWDLIVRENWTSVTVTITAAVIRVCLGFQMGIFTAMVASLLIERTGVPIGSAPLISMLRAVSTSPYNLVSRKTLTTPWGFAIGLAVLLTGASNFTSTALLVDFESFSIITPEQTIDLLYGSSGPEDVSDPGSRDMSGNSAIGNLRGSKIWNSQPNSYFRFAELSSYGSTPDPDVDTVDDSGTILRAILPFANVSHRTNLRSYDGPSVVFDSRVVCTRPNITDLNFSVVLSRNDRQKPKEEKTNERRGNGRPYQFHEVFVTGSFKIPNNPALFRADYNPFPRGWSFRCVMPAPKATEEALYWPISICATTSGMRTRDSIFTRMPQLLSTILPSLDSGTSSTFLIFNTTGPIEEWRKYLQNGEPEDTNLSGNSPEDWDFSEDGIWVHWRPRSGSIDAMVSISTCVTNLPGVYKTVSMSSDDVASEPTLSWDRVTERYDTDSFQDRYSNLTHDAVSPGLRGILSLRPNADGDFMSDLDMNNETSNKTVDRLMFFNSVAGGLPYMNLNGVDERLEVQAGGILLPGANSPYAVHYAHAAIFQDIAKTTNSLAQGLQGLFTVLPQMAYYENFPYFDYKSRAILTLSSEKLIPTRWLGFILVTVTVVVHFSLLAVITALFLGWTQASWLGNVWVSLSQVVSYETKDFIEKSTDQDDEAVAKMILKVSSAPGGESKYRVRVKCNESNGRNELSLI